MAALQMTLTVEEALPEIDDASISPERKKLLLQELLDICEQTADNPICHADFEISQNVADCIAEVYRKVESHHPSLLQTNRGETS